MLRSDLGDAAGWRFACLSPLEGYIAAVAVNDSAAASIDVQVRDFHTLLPKVATEISS